jgi:hypothetical protein
VVLCALSLVASPARAVDAELERASALLEGGDAAGALRVVAHVEARTDLPASELLPLLILRARAHAALGDAAALSLDARTLVAVAPSWQAAADAPEALRAAVDEARVAAPAPPSLEVDVYSAPGAARLVVDVEDPLGVVRGTRLASRLAGDDAWRTTVGHEVVVRGQTGERVEYFVEALGPGGVVVARVGSATAPRHTSVPVSEGDPMGGLGTMMMADDSSSGSTWLIAGALAVGALVLAIVILAVGQGEQRTDLGVPIVEWP